MATDHHDQARALLRGAGARMTRARVSVLAALLEAPRALTHHEVESRVSRRGEIDRVTIYRVLEWLTGQALAHRIPGEDRVWRYNAAERAHRHAHPHFRCDRCAAVICLDAQASAPRVRVPAGFRSHEVELTVRGLCPACVRLARSRPGAHQRH